MSVRIRILVFILIAFVSGLKATHNRAGEITYKRIPPFTKVQGGFTVPVYNYSITVIKYTDNTFGDRTVADRCVDTVYFGDGQRGIAPRINGPVGGCNCGPNVGCGVVITQDVSNPNNPYIVKVNTYTIVHTYAGPGEYRIRSFDPNRNADVINIPLSVEQPFYVESLLIITAFTGANSSPVFNFPPIDRACTGACFEHNPGAYDPDKGDSLSFEITTSRAQNGSTVPGYFYPNAGSGGVYEIDARTGLLRWCTPQQIGEYNIAFIVKEWRKNTNDSFELIGYVLRDMQVIVTACNNDPPIITVPADTCVEAGALIEKNIGVTDPDIGDIVTLTGGGGPFSAPAPVASLNNTVGQITSPAGFVAKFRWQTNCDHVRSQPYQATFKALDDGRPIKLASFRSFNIRVVPPSVKNVTAVPAGSAIRVSWDAQTCIPSGNPLLGYRIYRKNDCATLTPVPCQTGVSAASGFSLIGTAATGINTFLDDNNGDGLVVGENYSYLVVAYYEDGTQTFASSSVCTKLKRDVPVILNVDVDSTSTTTGQVWVRWTRPIRNSENLDTVAFPGPYRFNLKHGSAGNFTTIFTTTDLRLEKLDTVYMHTGLNTLDLGHEYIVEFIAADTVRIGSSQRATSVFLKSASSDRQIDLDWTSQTPWKNKQFTVFRKDPGSSVYVALTPTVSVPRFSDSVNVTNGVTYCYKVLASGEYSDPGIFKPLLNHTQEHCTKAVDKTPPCTPTISLEANCVTGFVSVRWNDVSKICRRSDDVEKYVLYFKSTIGESYAEVTSGMSFSYVYDGLEWIQGCYAIQAVDSNGNASQLSPDFCIDNCPEFELPNIFTPNGDGANDVYKAVKVRQIMEINLQIVDRWGNTVFRTTDPYFTWNGTSDITDVVVAEGTLFYICDVYEPRLQGVTKRTLKGYVHVAR